MARQSLESHRKIEHLLHERFVLISLPEVRVYLESLRNGDTQLIRYSLCYRVTLRVSSIESSGDVSDSSLCLERTEGDDLRHLVLAVLSYDVIDYFLTPFDAEVYVYIRHAHTLRIQESFKNKTVFDRVYLCDIEAVCDYASCGRPSARSDSYAVGFGIMDEVPYYEEVFNITHSLDDLEFCLKSLPVEAFRIHRLSAVAPDQAFIAQIPEVFTRTPAVRRDVFRQVIVTEFKLYIAPFGDLM